MKIIISLLMLIPIANANSLLADSEVTKLRAQIKSLQDDNERLNLMLNQSIDQTDKCLTKLEQINGR